MFGLWLVFPRNVRRIEGLSAVIGGKSLWNGPLKDLRRLVPAAKGDSVTQFVKVSIFAFRTSNLV